ncbi:MAG TPA: hypothetical protein VKY24_03450 [Reyranella sp.]|nr:hypothetical protein [Reyranella sp.]
MSVSSTDAVRFSGITSGPSPAFELKGGKYSVTMLGTSGKLALQLVGLGGSNVTQNDEWGNPVESTDLSTPYQTVVDLAAGTYQFTDYDNTHEPVGGVAGLARIPR